MHLVENQLVPVDVAKRGRWCLHSINQVDEPRRCEHDTYRAPPLSWRKVDDRLSVEVLSNPLDELLHFAAAELVELAHGFDASFRCLALERQHAAANLRSRSHLNDTCRNAVPRFEDVGCGPLVDQVGIWPNLRWAEWRMHPPPILYASRSIGVARSAKRIRNIGDRSEAGKWIVL